MTEDQEKFETHFKNLKKAAARFKEALQREPGDLLIQDGTIQRFEFTFELAWKTMKAFLREKKMMDIGSNPREVLKKAFEIKLIDDLDGWEAMLDSRNQTVHVYGQNEVNEIYRFIRGEGYLFENLIESLAKNK